MQVRTIVQSDYEEVYRLNYFFGLNFQWNRAFEEQNKFVAIDDQDRVCGAAGLSRDGTWYYLEKEAPVIPLYRMQAEYMVLEGVENGQEIADSLLEALKSRFEYYVNQHPCKNLAMRIFCREFEKDKMEFLLQNEFTAFGVIPILSYDLTGKIKNPVVNNGVEITILEKNNENFDEYMQSNQEGFDGVQDSPDETYFRLQGEETKVFAAIINEKVVSSCTIWRIDEGLCATENIFTIPQYRRQGLARATILSALCYLQQQGEKEASLTVIGDNAEAMKLYFSIGYRLQGYVYEFHWSKRIH